MKVLIVGSDEVYSIEHFYLEYLREAGVDVSKLPAQSIFYAWYQSGIVHKLLFKAGLSSIYKHINQLFRRAVEELRPDIIWVFKGMEIFPASLEWAHRRGIKLVNYNPDNPFIFTGKGSGNSNVTDSIPMYDLHFTYNLEVKRQLEEQHKAEVAWLPFGFDIPDGLFERCVQEPEVMKCCLLGNPDPQRAAFVQQLAERGIEIDIYGNDWKKFVSHDNITLYPPVYKEGFWRTLYRYRVQLNMMRIHNLQSHNMRTFEVPATGGIQLAPDTPEHRFFFTPGKEIFLYKDILECATAVREILSLNSGQAAVIRKDARTRSMQSGYSYRERTLQALETMKRLVHG